MSSFSAHLHVAGRVYRLVKCYYSFHQLTNRRGRPVTKVRKGPVHLEIDTSEDLGELEAWAASPTKTESGRLVFLRLDAEQELYYVWFQDATCVDYQLDFASTGVDREGALRASVTLSCVQMGFGNGTGEDWIPPSPRAYESQPQAAPRKRGRASAGALTTPSSPPKAKNPKLAAGTPEHKADRWSRYQQKNAGNPDAWDQARWEKQYATNMQNATRGLAREREYCAALNGGSKTLKTAFTQRQIDIYRASDRYCGQLKTGKVSFGDQAKIDLRKDHWLIRKQYKVEYILEKGASKNFLKALDKIGASVKIGPQIP